MHPTNHRPNIVLVVLDTHRWDRLGCYGYSRGTSPNLDAFAREGMLFERAIAPAQWTIPSHASMFSGEPPGVHWTLQSDDVLHPRFKTVAERLQVEGYQTVGFCNNPLVGVLDNGLRRGFDAFHNYGGAFPVGVGGAVSGGMVRHAWRLVGRALRRAAQPIQNAFARSATLFLGALDPFWVPIWTGIANFKGDTARSIHDVAAFIEHQRYGQGHDPYFVFLNLMETHLPYTPPASYAEAFAPSYAEGGEASDFMEDFNRRAGDWFTPPEEPFSAVERQVLGEMYDAEVAYQDHLLAELLETLNQPARRDDTFVVFVGDHGEMLGEHRLMGHAFGVYEELIHVPLMMRWPGQRDGERIGESVSVTRLFHTLLEAGGVDVYEDVSGERLAARELSLRHVTGGDGPALPVVCEAYAPRFAVQVMESRKPALIEDLHCRATHWAVYEEEHKLISVEGVGDELLLMSTESGGFESLEGETDVAARQRLVERLASCREQEAGRRPDVDAGRADNVDEAAIQRRLRDLGYLE